ncbi:hypothetical protein C8J57DRAFT_1506422 [Mycena rebaudengoi]|nr:hypothetical protein C8J57DRAFT_1506422 [Mycena rebaudengoi]
MPGTTNLPHESIDFKKTLILLLETMNLIILLALLASLAVATPAETRTDENTIAPGAIGVESLAAKDMKSTLNNNGKSLLLRRVLHLMVEI